MIAKRKKQKKNNSYGFRIKRYPDGLESVRKSVENAEQLCGLDRNVMARLLKGEWSQSTTLNSTGRQSKKIVIEYDVTNKNK